MSDKTGHTYAPSALREDKDFVGFEGEGYLKRDFEKGPEDVQLLYAVEADAILALVRYGDAEPVALTNTISKRPGTALQNGGATPTAPVKTTVGAPGGRHP
jgi:hypothetical protein